MAQSGYRKCDDEVAHCAKGLATAKMSLLLAQNGYRNCDNEIVPCANCHRNCVWIIVVIANACSLLGLKECSSVRLPFAMDMLVSPVKNESAQQSIVITAQTI